MCRSPHKLWEETVRRTVSTIALFIASALAVPQPAFAKEGKVPPLIAQINGGNWLDPQEVEELRDGLFYQRAIHALHDDAAGAQRDRDARQLLGAVGAGYNVLPI
jgi:hypothetical protein